MAPSPAPAKAQANAAAAATQDIVDDSHHTLSIVAPTVHAAIKTFQSDHHAAVSSKSLVPQGFPAVLPLSPAFMMRPSKCMYCNPPSY